MDECHHAQADHPTACILRAWHKSSQRTQASGRSLGMPLICMVLTAVCDQRQHRYAWHVHSAVHRRAVPSPSSASKPFTSDPPHHQPSRCLSPHLQILGLTASPAAKASLTATYEALARLAANLGAQYLVLDETDPEVQVRKGMCDPCALTRVPAMHATVWAVSMRGLPRKRTSAGA